MFIIIYRSVSAKYDCHSHLQQMIIWGVNNPGCKFCVHNTHGYDTVVAHFGCKAIIIHVNLACKMVLDIGQIGCVNNPASKFRV